jgi:hypothetical protein
MTVELAPISYYPVNAVRFRGVKVGDKFYRPLFVEMRFDQYSCGSERIDPSRHRNC